MIKPGRYAIVPLVIVLSLSGIWLPMHLPLAHAVTLPPGILTDVPITISNGQSVSTPSPFQQMITVNSASFSSSEASNLQNVEFFQADGTLVPSWLESGNSNSATSSIYWLKLQTAIPASGSITLYIGFAATSTNLFDGAANGEASNLSPAYGQYDNGANIFNFYDNFVGTSLGTSWTSYIPQGGSLSVNNGLTISGPAGTFCGYNVDTEIDSGSAGAQFTGPTVLDTNFAIGPGSSNFRFGFRDTNLCNIQDGFTGNGNTLDYAYPSNIQLSTTNGGNGVYNPSCNTVANGWSCATLGNQPDNNPHIMSIAATSSSATYSLDYQQTNAVSINTNTPSYSSSIGIGLEENYYSNPVQVSWIRTRALPPNGQMPSGCAPSCGTGGGGSPNLITSNAIVNNFQNSITLPNGSPLYLYGLVTGGIAGTSGFANGEYASVLNVDGNIVGALAITASNTNSFTTSAAYPAIGGVAVSGFSSYTPSFGSNGNAAAQSASDTFTVTVPGSLVVVVADAGGEQSISISGVPGMAIDSTNFVSPCNQGLPPVIWIGHAFPNPGTYTVTEQTTQCAAGQDPNHAGDLIGVFIFSPSSVQESIGLLTPCINGLTIDLNGGASPGSSVSSIAWAWGDGAQTIGFFPESHTYPQSGTYPVVVTANFNDGSSVSTTQTVTVGPGELSGCDRVSIFSNVGGTVAYSFSGGSSVIQSSVIQIIYVAQGEPIFLTASPKLNFEFSSWSLTSAVSDTFNGMTVDPTSAAIAVVVSGDGSIAAEFGAFQLTVFPVAQTIGLTAAAAYVVSVPIEGTFGNTVALSVQGLPQGLGCSFADVYHASVSTTSSCSTQASPGQTATLYVYAADSAIGSASESAQESFTISATAGTLKQSQDLSLLIEKVTGLQNSVSLNQLYILSSSPACPIGISIEVRPPQCFTLQQNFWIGVPGNASPTYWAQDVLTVGVDSGSVYIAPEYDIFSASDTMHAIAGAGTLGFSTSYTKVTLPATFVLKSTLTNSEVDLSVTYTSSGGNKVTNTFTYSLPAQGSYVFLDGGVCPGSPGACAKAPQLDIVGPPGGGQTSFCSDPSTCSVTSGSIATSIQVTGQQWSQSVKQNPTISTSTQETSSNLHYTLFSQNTAGFSSGPSPTTQFEQGLAYPPDLTVTPQASSRAVIVGGSIFVDQSSATGVTTSITGSTLPDGSQLTIKSTIIGSSQPQGTGTLSIGALGFFDVQVSGLGGTTSGNARVCITNENVSPQTTIQYFVPGVGWVNAGNPGVSGGTVCGTIPVEFLSGTFIVIGNPPIISISQAFTDTSLNLIPEDQYGNLFVNAVLSNGRVRSINPGQVLTWVNVTNIGNALLQSLKLNETLPVDWTVHPSWLPALGGITVFFVFLNGTRLDITGQTTVTVSSGNPEQITLSISNMTATIAGESLGPGESILLEAKLSYGLTGTSQSFTSYPRTYNDTSNASAWMQTSFVGGQASASGSASFIAHAKVNGDVNGDGVVNLQDASMMVYAFGARPGDARWNPALDVLGEGVIDLQDVSYVFLNYGNHA